jgi:hypothetical protein
MRKAIAVAVIGLAASLASAATVKLQPLNVKAGLWQTTSALKYTGLPPQMAAAERSQITYKSCLKPEDLMNPNKWAAKELAGLKCSSLAVLKSTGTDIEAQGKGCSMGDRGITADGHGKFHVQDPEHVAGSLDVTWSGNTPFGNFAVHGHGDYVDKWLGATCPEHMR